MYFMKHLHRIAAGLAALLAVSLSACGSQPADNAGADTADHAAALMPYDAPSGRFTLSVPEIEGGWTVTDGGNDEHLVLDNSDQSFTVMVQALPLDQSLAFFSNLDELATYHQQTTLSTFGDAAEAEVAIGGGPDAPEIENVKSASYTVELSGVTARAQVSYFQTDGAYYNLTITGLADVYDANIGKMQSALSSFHENAL